MVKMEDLSSNQPRRYPSDDGTYSPGAILPERENPRKSFGSLSQSRQRHDSFVDYADRDLENRRMSRIPGLEPALDADGRPLPVEMLYKEFSLKKATAHLKKGERADWGKASMVAVPGDPKVLETKVKAYRKSHKDTSADFARLSEKQQRVVQRVIDRTLQEDPHEFADWVLVYIRPNVVKSWGHVETTSIQVILRRQDVAERRVRDQEKPRKAQDNDIIDLSKPTASSIYDDEFSVSDLRDPFRRDRRASFLDRGRLQSDAFDKDFGRGRDRPLYEDERMDFEKMAKRGKGSLQRSKTIHEQRPFNPREFFDDHKPSTSRGRQTDPFDQAFGIGQGPFDDAIVQEVFEDQQQPAPKPKKKGKKAKNTAAQNDMDELLAELDNLNKGDPFAKQNDERGNPPMNFGQSNVIDVPPRQQQQPPYPQSLPPNFNAGHPDAQGTSGQGRNHQRQPSGPRTSQSWFPDNQDAVRPPAPEPPPFNYGGQQGTMPGAWNEDPLNFAVDDRGYNPPGMHPPGNAFPQSHQGQHFPQHGQPQQQPQSARHPFEPLPHIGFPGQYTEQGFDDFDQRIRSDSPARKRSSSRGGREERSRRSSFEKKTLKRVEGKMEDINVRLEGIVDKIDRWQASDSSEGRVEGASTFSELAVDKGFTPPSTPPRSPPFRRGTLYNKDGGAQRGSQYRSRYKGSRYPDEVVEIEPAYTYKDSRDRRMPDMQRRNSSYTRPKLNQRAATFDFDDYPRGSLADPRGYRRPQAQRRLTGGDEMYDVDEGDDVRGYREASAYVQSRRQSHVDRVAEAAYAAGMMESRRRGSDAFGYRP